MSEAKELGVLVDAGKVFRLLVVGWLAGLAWFSLAVIFNKPGLQIEVKLPLSSFNILGG